MKRLSISFITMFVLIVIWSSFFSYSHQTLDSLSAAIDTRVLPAVESESWDESAAELENALNQWNDYRDKALFILDNERINQIDECFSRSSKYILAEDISNAAGELDALSDKLLLITENEQLSLQNIL